MAGKIGNKLIAPFVYGGTMTSTLFEWWMENELLKKLSKGSTIVMDNASFHRKEALREMIERKGLRLIFLPPYSPELNPIEKYWAALKRKLREILPNFPSFSDALDYILREDSCA